MDEQIEKGKSLSLMTRRRFLFGLVSTICIGLKTETSANAAIGLFEPFTFGYVTDAHVCLRQPDSYKMLQESQLFLQDVVKSLNGHNVAFTIFGGDNVESPGKDDTNWQLFLDVAQGLTAPWNFVLGESDVSGLSPVNKMRTFGPDWKGKGIETNQSYWSRDPVDGVHIIGLDTSRTNSNTGDLGKAQLDWLKEDLKMHQRRFTIAFSHHPLLPPPPYDGGPPWDDYIVPNGDSAREIFGSSKYVRLVISGHVHVSKVQQERDIWYVSCPSLAVYPCAYRLFRVTPESITIETYQVSFPALVKKARLALATSAMAYKYSSNRPASFADLADGSRLDSEVSLPLVAGKPIQPIAKKKPVKGKKEEPKKEKSKKEKPKEKPSKEKSSKDKPAKVDESKKDESDLKNDLKNGEAESKSDAGDLKVAPDTEPVKSDIPAKESIPETK